MPGIPRTPSSVLELVNAMHKITVPSPILLFIDELLLAAHLEETPKLTIEYNGLHRQLVEHHFMWTPLTAERFFLVYGVAITQAYANAGWKVIPTENGWEFLLSTPEEETVSSQNLVAFKRRS